MGVTMPGVTRKNGVTIFCCYAREDRPSLLALKKHLLPMERAGRIIVKSDIDISPGEEWEQKITDNLNTAQIIVLLISPDFLASDYCYGVEMRRAMERYERGEVRVIPIIVRSCVWKEAPFGKLQVLPTNAQPVLGPGWHTQDEAFVDVAQGLQQAITEVTQAELSQTVLQKTALLSPGIQIGIYKSNFGDPIFVNYHEEKKTKEYVFVHESFYLDAMTDPTDTVMCFALTIRDATFHPVFTPKNGYGLQVTLGESTFGSVQPDPEIKPEIYTCVGANWFSYYETYYFGRSGNYQEFGVGLNEAGYIAYEQLEAHVPSLKRSSQRRCPASPGYQADNIAQDQIWEDLQAMRKNTLINTYAEAISPKAIEDYAGLILGVSKRQVSTLKG